MNKSQFLDYVDANFTIDSGAWRLFCNVLDYIERNFKDPVDQYEAAKQLLDGTFGFTNQELRMINFRKE